VHPRSASRRVPIPVRIPGRGARRPERSGAGTSAASADAVPVTPDPPVDAAFALTRTEADALCGAVAATGQGRPLAADPLTSASAPPTPARRWSLSPDALRTGIEEMADLGTDDGSVEVLRLPGALRSPEMWHVRLIGVRPDIAERVAAAVRRAQGRDERDVR
jgi:hypothetical protein